MGDYSFEGLQRFLKYAADKGLMKRETADGRRRAAERILSVMDSSELEDLRNVDLEEASRRFMNRQGTEYKPESLRVYTSRLRSAVGDFVSYVDDPSSFKPSVQQRTRGGNAEGKRKGKERNESKQRPASSGGEGGTGPKRHHGGSESGGRETDPTGSSLTIPIPVRDGLMVYLKGIPADLSEREADKIANVIRAYAVKDEG